MCVWGSKELIHVCVREQGINIYTCVGDQGINTCVCGGARN